MATTERELREVREENQRLWRIADAAAEACREREITAHLIDLLDAEGLKTAPRAPDPEVWSPRRTGKEAGDGH